jgi:hypothetical protein
MEIPQDEINEIIYNIDQLIDIANNNEDGEMLSLCYETKDKLAKYSIKQQEIQNTVNNLFNQSNNIFNKSNNLLSK